MRRAKGWLVGLLAATAVGGLVAAADAQPRMGPGRMTDGERQLFHFGQIDADHDGVVTQAEYFAYRDKMFAAMDKDKSGSISMPEHGGLSPGRGMERHFKGVNRSSSGQITKQEWTQESQEMFAERDKNKDGKLTPDEFGPLMRHGRRM